jgi:uncharacterized protein YlzI (FlbEa/FlbD family)
MASFVKLTRAGGKPVWINPEQIVSCQPDYDTGGRTLVQTTKDMHMAEENIETVMGRLGVQSTISPVKGAQA